MKKRNVGSGLDVDTGDGEVYDYHVAAGRTHILTSVDFINNDVLLCFCLYLSTCSINYVCSSISGLYCGAHQFDLPDLSQACVDFVERCLRHNRSKQILSSARAYSHFKYTGELFDKVCN